MRLPAASLLVLCWPAWLCGQPRYYTFSVDQDGLSGAPDFSRLNHPLEPADRVFARDGHFWRVGPDLAPGTADDERLRFFGLNLCFGANFPEPGDAVRLAERLRRLGVNLVRLHHMDSQPDANPENAGSTLTRGPYPTLNQVAIRRLRALLDALAANGIYANVNLHVGYQFRPAVDGVPEHPAFPSQSKPLHIFWPRMVQLQADYAFRLLEALGLRSDPVLAMVEINNESSLARDWQTGNLDNVLAGEYRAELQRQWNEFLRQRYGETAA
ncbi:MAG: capsular biosynthesis protein, partial [Bryobacteraceae bacterium]